MPYEPTNILKILGEYAQQTLMGVTDYRTRSNRVEMIVGAWLINWAIGTLEWVVGLVGNLAFSSVSNAVAARILAGGLSVVFLTPLLVRRLHDFNFSGWWVLPPLVPIPLSLLATATGTRWSEWGGHSRIIIDVSNLGLLALLFLAMWIAIMAIPGTDGPNRFGDPS